MTNVPQEINNYPVVAYVGGQEFPDRAGVVVVKRPPEHVHQANLNYVVWRVWQTASGEWHAESGIYDLSYEGALNTLARRCGIDSRG